MSNATTGLYHYDGDGRRVKKMSAKETTVFVYDGGGQLVAEYSTQLATTPQVSYLTGDNLGSPRVLTNQFGAVTTRKDYMAFGEETYTTERTSALNYDNESETRKGYTGYEKDDESGLDFAQARYYNSAHGRFTSVDPLMASANVKNPQTFNRYSYVLNSPYKFTDPLGLLSSSTGACGQWCAGSGPYVDRSAFRGNDTTLNKIFDDMQAQRQAAPPVAPPPPAVEQNKDNPTNPNAPEPGSAEFIAPEFSSLNGNENTQAAYNLLVNTNGEDGAEAAYNEFTPYQKAVFLNTVAGIVSSGDKILSNAKFEDFYYGDSDNAQPFGIIVSGVTTKQLDAGGLRNSIFGRRSSSKIEIASVEATVEDKKSGKVAFDIDLYNPKTDLRNITRHLKEVKFNSDKEAITHPADVARA